MNLSARIIHGLAVVALGVGLGLLLIVQGFMPVSLVEQGLMAFNWVVWGAWAVVLVFCAYAIAKKLSWKFIVPGLLLVSGVLAYLAVDDGERPPEADLGPRLSREAESYHIVMWMGKRSPFSRVTEPGFYPMTSAH